MKVLETYSVINRFVRVAVLQVQWIDDHSLSQFESISYPEIISVLCHCLHLQMRQQVVDNLPHRGTIKVGQKPLVRVAIKRHGVLDTFHQIFKFRADKGIASVSSINVEPCSSLLSNRSCMTGKMKSQAPTSLTSSRVLGKRTSYRFRPNCRKRHRKSFPKSLKQKTGLSP